MRQQGSGGGAVGLKSLSTYIQPDLMIVTLRLLKNFGSKN